nr:MAG TPA: hypothetical protein [Caudoviricetes sp.]
MEYLNVIYRIYSFFGRNKKFNIKSLMTGMSLTFGAIHFLPRPQLVSI